MRNVSVSSSITRTDKILFAVCTLLLLFSAYLQFDLGNLGDKDWLLYVARMWLGGKKLYVDLFEPELPLITWIYVIPVYLSIYLGFFKDYQYLVILGFFLIAFILFISLKLINFHPEFANNKRKKIEFALLFLFVFIYFTNSAYFFDREHIFLVLVFPYLLRWLPSIMNAPIPRYLKIIMGIMAGIGFCIKPHCAIVFVGIQLIVLIRERSGAILLSIENSIIYLIGSAYIAAIWVFTPEYILVVLPMELVTYSAANRKIGGLTYFSITLFTFGVTFADFRLRYTSPYRKDIFYLAFVCLSFLGYALLNNGWGYSWNPLASIVFMITGFVLWEAIYLKKHYQAQGLPFQNFVLGARACAINLVVNAIIILGLWAYIIPSSCGHYYLECDKGKVFLNQITEANGGQKIKSFGSISIDFEIWTELVRATGSSWETRFNCLWMLPKFFLSDENFVKKNKWILEYISHALAEDMRKNKPEIMFVDNTDNFYTFHEYVDLVAYLNKFPEFKKEFTHYRYVEKISPCKPEKNTQPKEHCGYFIYKRID